MVQILPARERRERGPTVGQRLAEGVGKGLEVASKIYEESQKKKVNEQQYQQENEKYKKLTGSDLSRNEKTREKEIEFALKGEHEIKGQKAKFENKEREDAAKLAGEQKTQKELMSFADRLEASDPKFKGVADIYRLDIPLDQKTKIVQSITGTDVYKEDQQRRLQLDSVLKRYNSRLKEVDDEIKNVRNPNSTGLEEVNELRKQRMALRNERDQLLDFRALNGMEEEEELAAEDEVELEGLDEEGAGPKVTFDPSNKGHKAAAEKLYKKYKDKEKVRKILSKKFKGL